MAERAYNDIEQKRRTLKPKEVDFFDLDEDQIVTREKYVDLHSLSCLTTMLNRLKPRIYRCASFKWQNGRSQGFAETLAVSLLPLGKPGKRKRICKSRRHSAALGKLKKQWVNVWEHVKAGGAQATSYCEHGKAALVIQIGPGNCAAMN